MKTKIVGTYSFEHDLAHTADFVFRCQIPFQYTLEDGTSPSFPCRPKPTNGEGSSLGGVRPHICDVVHAGSTTGFDYGVAFRFYDANGSSCSTNYLDMLYYDELVRGSSELYSQTGAMGGCYGFDLGGGPFRFEVLNTGADALCLDGVDAYSVRATSVFGGLVPPSVRCRLPGPVWTEESQAGPFECSGRPTHLAHVVVQVLRFESCLIKVYGIQYVGTGNMYSEILVDKCPYN